MKKLLDYVVMIVFMAGVLAGVQVPGFVDQYGRSLEAHYRESATALLAFQDDADRYFKGDLEKLIRHYRNKVDPVFQDGGESIQAIYQRNQMLAQAMEAFHKNAFSPYLHVFLNAVPSIKEEVWRNYTYAVRLDKSAILGGVSAGLLAALTAEFAFFAFTGIGKRILGSWPQRRKARG